MVQWLLMVRAMMTEAEWAASKRIPATMEEYMWAGRCSIGGLILPGPAFLVGPELSEEVVRSEEFSQLMTLTDTISRLLNDVMTYEREMAAGKPNSVLLHALALDGGGGSPSPATVEAAKVEIGRTIRESRWELQRLVFRDGGIVPRPIREMFWQTSKVASVFYRDGDHFSPTEMLSAVNEVIMDPLKTASEERYE